MLIKRGGEENSNLIILNDEEIDESKITQAWKTVKESSKKLKEDSNNIECNTESVE